MNIPFIGTKLMKYLKKLLSDNIQDVNGQKFDNQELSCSELFLQFNPFFEL